MAGPVGLEGSCEEVVEAGRGEGMAYGPIGAQGVFGTVVCEAGWSAGMLGLESHGKGCAHVSGLADCAPAGEQ